MNLAVEDKKNNSAYRNVYLFIIILVKDHKTTLQEKIMMKKRFIEFLSSFIIQLSVDNVQKGSFFFFFISLFYSYANISIKDNL